MPGPCTADSVQLLCGSDVYNHGIFNNAYIYACHTTVTELESTFENNYSGHSLKAAMTADSLNLVWVNGQWHTLAFDDPFDYNGGENLILEFRWEGDDGNSVYDLGYYTSGNRAVNATSSTAPTGVPRNYMPRMRIFYSATGIGESSIELPATHRTLQAAPNPFREQTAIRVRPTASSSRRGLRIHDAAGHLVRAIAVPQSAASNPQDVVWDGRDMSGKPVSPGTYFCRIGTRGGFETLLLVKQQ
jgi:hypothetical protein